MGIPKANLPSSDAPVKTRDISGTLRALQEHPLLDGVHLTDLSLDGSGDFAGFKHGLKRPYVGVIITSQSNTDVYIRILQPNDPYITDTMKIDASTHIAVQPTGFGEPDVACTFNCWVF
jgi:hypothetical protein